MACLPQPLHLGFISSSGLLVINTYMQQKPGLKRVAAVWRFLVSASERVTAVAVDGGRSSQGTKRDLGALGAVSTQPGWCSWLLPACTSPQNTAQCGVLPMGTTERGQEGQWQQLLKPSEIQQPKDLWIKSNNSGYKWILKLKVCVCESTCLHIPLPCESKAGLSLCPQAETWCEQPGPGSSSWKPHPPVVEGGQPLYSTWAFLLPVMGWGSRKKQGWHHNPCLEAQGWSWPDWRGSERSSGTGKPYSHSSGCAAPKGSTSQVLLRNLDQALQNPFSIQFWDPSECYCASCKLTLLRVLLFPWAMGIRALQSLVTAEASLLEQGEKQEKEAQLVSWLEPAEATAVSLKITEVSVVAFTPRHAPHSRVFFSSLWCHVLAPGSPGVLQSSGSEPCFLLPAKGWCQCLHPSLPRPQTHHRHQTDHQKPLLENAGPPGAPACQSRYL